MNTLWDITHVLCPEPAKPPLAPLRMRQTVFQDYAQIAALQLRNRLTMKSCQDWLALWKGNPVYDASAGEWPIGWVLEREGGEIVGSLGNLPFEYQFRGRQLRAASPCGWAVDPHYRSYSLLLLSRFLKQKEVDLFIFSTVGPQAEPVAKALRLPRVPVGQWDKSVFWITNKRGFSEAIMSSKSALLRDVMRYPAAAAFFCWDRLHDIRMRVGGLAAKIEMYTVFDRRFDEFWEELKQQNDNVLLASRSQETLRWHFRKTPERPATWTVAVRDASRLTACATFDRLDSAHGLKRVRLIDFQALRGYEEALGAILRWMLNWCREEGIHALEVTGCWLDRPGFPKVAAPFHRTLPCWVYYYKAREKQLSEALRDPAVWAPSSFDGDASL